MKKRKRKRYSFRRADALSRIEKKISDRRWAILKSPNYTDGAVSRDPLIKRLQKARAKIEKMPL